MIKTKAYVLIAASCLMGVTGLMPSNASVPIVHAATTTPDKQTVTFKVRYMISIMDRQYQLKEETVTGTAGENYTFIRPQILDAESFSLAKGQPASVPVTPDLAGQTVTVNYFSYSHLVIGKIVLFDRTSGENVATWTHSLGMGDHVNVQELVPKGYHLVDPSQGDYWCLNRESQLIDVERDSPAPNGTQPLQPGPINPPAEQPEKPVSPESPLDPKQPELPQSPLQPESPKHPDQSTPIDHPEHSTSDTKTPSHRPDDQHSQGQTGEGQQTEVTGPALGSKLKSENKQSDPKKKRQSETSTLKTGTKVVGEKIERSNDKLPQTGEQTWFSRGLAVVGLGLLGLYWHRLKQRH
ncbi:hypothetical protein [Levilactobacillus bambusae]|uniref:Gram-positive cocci surface proteins LPxTG domain-containing protein n=1 Tax=Levilactobacillus bambusae TaxID=2024736 RepID=A0A2V1MY54_9LACO|nr:hypothetical protein [Levilactobacillus bambusae]PWF99447.1 hypothetical protein DCM90_08325 [Levilactobacillus bambusae]